MAQIVFNSNDISFERIFRFIAWIFVILSLVYVLPRLGLEITSDPAFGKDIPATLLLIPRLLVLSGIPIVAFVEIMYRWRIKRGATATEAAIFLIASIVGVTLCGLVVPWYYGAHLSQQSYDGFFPLLCILTGAVVSGCLLTLTLKRPSRRRRRR